MPMMMPMLTPMMLSCSLLDLRNLFHLTLLSSPPPSSSLLNTNHNHVHLSLYKVSVQINWINYLQFRFGWSAAKSGSTLMLVGFAVAVLPQLFK